MTINLLLSETVRAAAESPQAILQFTLVMSRDVVFYNISERPEDKIITVSNRHRFSHFCYEVLPTEKFSLRVTCFHPSAVSLSVSLSVRSETGSAQTPCQEDKLFCEKE